jgi:hypothetical protein
VPNTWSSIKELKGRGEVLKRRDDLIARGHQRKEERGKDNDLMGILIRNLSREGTTKRQ